MGSAYVLAGPGWHPGVIGIVAGRIKEKTGKPSLVIALDDARLAKARAARSAGLTLGAAIIAAREAGLLVAGGGHAMAAGLTVAEDQTGRLHRIPHRASLEKDVARARTSQSMLLDLSACPRWPNARPRDHLRCGWPLWRGMARSTGCGWSGADRQGRYRRQRSFARSSQAVQTESHSRRLPFALQTEMAQTLLAPQQGPTLSSCRAE